MLLFFVLNCKILQKKPQQTNKLKTIKVLCVNSGVELTELVCICVLLSGQSFPVRARIHRKIFICHFI